MGMSMSLESTGTQQNPVEEEAAAADNANMAPFRQQSLHASRRAGAMKSVTYARLCMIVFGSFCDLLKMGQRETKDIFVRRLRSQSKHREHHLAMVVLGMLGKGQTAI
jgi:hypothetical protein